ncbi:metallophosphoesterase family protein [Microbispora sp. ATCC PTA-5024]|uniref:metallophosphoesterase family protein n=1 Tax=Microbispora sp. ATCC PTA-5024 TaxID=316330 RepID=UPI0003DBD3A7|nr:metallophosphoesterase [Microbispora sp. ATCC PTA-5024]ETK37137.1 metallophosphoesterase [Microbispora sp. ATCC PTA-5024]
MAAEEKGNGRLLAISDLHVAYAENRAVVEDLRPRSDGDWLLVAGDVGERIADVEWALGLLKERFATVAWVPGNHELWTTPGDPEQLRGEERYRRLVQICRRLGVLTPEDPYPVWTGAGGPATVVPLFLLYDYSFRPPRTTREQALARAYESGVVCTDEFLLHPHPYPSREAWCRARLRESEARLDDRDPGLPTVLVNHFPLLREPTEVLRHQPLAQWCGTEHTADWHLRYRAAAVVYGHLHIPRTTWHDGVRFEEVSLGYPRERRPHHRQGRVLRQILPERGAA